MTREERDVLLKDTARNLERIAEALENISAHLEEGYTTVMMPGVERVLGEIGYNLA